MPDLYYREKLPSHPLLGRNVRHDPRSRAYALGPRVAAKAADLGEVAWPSYVPVLDQGNVGSCTGESGVAAVYAPPMVRNNDQRWRYTPDQDGAYRLYAATTASDPYEGTWTYPPPGGVDTGSDGLSIAKELTRAEAISGYLWAFTADEALGALATSGVLTGVPWFYSMFDVASDGLVTVDTTSGLAGGHEVYVWRHRPAVGTSRARVGFRNSWGTSWGDHGEGWLSVADWLKLLRMNGDVTKLVPATQPAPDPAPPAQDPRDVVLEAETREWRRARHVGTNARAAASVSRWVKAKGLSGLANRW